MSWVDYKKYPFSYILADGNWDSAHNVYIFGSNPTVGTTEELIWDQSGSYAGFITDPSTLGLVSTSADDNGVTPGNGAHEVTVLGLDENYLPVREVFLLNGLTKVTSITTWRRVLRAFVSDGNDNSFSTGPNHGDINITAEDISGTPVMEFILTAQGKAHSCKYTVPEGYHALLLSAAANIGKGNDAEVHLLTRKINDNNTGVWNSGAHRYLYQNSFTKIYNIPRLVSEKSDIIMTGVSANTGNKVSASFELILIKGKRDDDSFFSDAE